MFDWLILVQTFAELCIVMRNFSRIAGSDAWHVCVELKKFESENFWDLSRLSLVISTVKCNDSVNFFFLFSFSSSLSTKYLLFFKANRCVFEVFRVCILMSLFYLRDCDRV